MSMDRDAHYEHRFDVIESGQEKLADKMDGVIEALNTLGRVEERQIAANKQMERLEWRMDQQEAHVDNLSARIIENQANVKFGERIFWFVGSAALAVFSAVFGSDFVG